MKKFLRMMMRMMNEKQKIKPQVVFNELNMEDLKYLPINVKPFYNQDLGMYLLKANNGLS